MYRSWRMQSELFALHDEQRRLHGQYMLLKRDFLAAKTVSAVSKTVKGRVIGLVVQLYDRSMHLLRQQAQVRLQRRWELERLVKLQCEMWQNDLQERRAQDGVRSIEV